MSSWGRSQFAARASFAVAWIAMVVAAFAVVRPSSIEVGLGSAQSSATQRGTLHQRGLCSVDGDCVDEDACTVDHCEAGTCTHTDDPLCVRCEPTYICPVIDAVFVMDTSGSMRDEAAALCAGIDEVAADFALQGVTLTTHILGITDNGDDGFVCLTDNVVNLLGGDVPGELAFCPFPNDISSFESWGPGTAIVAGRFPWVDGATRVVIPMSDEGACNGSRPKGCTLFGEDRDAVDNAAIVAVENGVIASPMTGSGSDACVNAHAQVLADNTGGRHEFVKDPAMIEGAIRRILLDLCTPDPSCDDQNACTDDDTCTNGACRGTPNYDASTDCCAPGTGNLTPLEDGNGCTVGVCDPVTGTVDQIPADEGTVCDDGDACTAMDLCDDAAGCAGTDINTFECTTDEDCFGAVCDTDAGHCFCTHIPTLCLEAIPSGLPDESCHTVGDEIVINVELGFSTNIIAGGNFLIEYDPAVLKFLDVVPGAEVDPTSPFSIKLFRNVDETSGTISFAVGIELGSSGDQGPAIMASIRFRALTACTSDELCFLDGNPFTTRLSDIEGQEVPFEPCCTGPLTINGTAPAFTCPSSVAVNADAGSTRATVRWSPVTVQSTCDPGLTFQCTATHSLGANVNHLIATGGLFPSGKATFTCTATDSCGATGGCSWMTEVRPLNTLEVSLELSPTIAADPSLQPLERCISFELFSNCVQPPAVVQETIEFGLPFNLTGHADAVLVKVPAGNYACITARDAQHTLRSSSPLQKVNGRYVAAFEGDPFFDGNWLVGGNVDGSQVIDILDFGILIEQYLSRRSVDTPCGSPSPHGDLNGDGFVDTLDLSFVSLNFLKADKDSCCPDAIAAFGPEPKTSVLISELGDVGVVNPRRLDTNGDGIFDLDDARSLLTQARQDKLRPVGR